MVDDFFTHPADKKSPVEVDEFVIHHVDDNGQKKGKMRKMASTQWMPKTPTPGMKKRLLRWI